MAPSLVLPKNFTVSFPPQPDAAKSSIARLPITLVPPRPMTERGGKPRCISAVVLRFEITYPRTLRARQSAHSVSFLHSSITFLTSIMKEDRSHTRAILGVFGMVAAPSFFFIFSFSCLTVRTKLQLSRSLSIQTGSDRTYFILSSPHGGKRTFMCILPLD